MISLRFLFGLGLVLCAIAVWVVSTYISARASKGPKERAFVLRICVLFWVILLSLLGLVYWLPSPYRYLAAGVYFVACPVFIYRAATKHQLIRLLERRDSAPDEASGS